MPVVLRRRPYVAFSLAVVALVGLALGLGARGGERETPTAIVLPYDPLPR